MIRHFDTAEACVARTALLTKVWEIPAMPKRSTQATVSGSAACGSCWLRIMEIRRPSLKSHRSMIHNRKHLYAATLLGCLPSICLSSADAKTMRVCIGELASNCERPFDKFVNAPAPGREAFLHGRRVLPMSSVGTIHTESPKESLDPAAAAVIYT